MIVEATLGTIALVGLGRGVWLGFRGRRGAASWLATASAFSLALASRLHGSSELAIVLVLAGATGVSATAVMAIRERLLERDRHNELADADDADVRGLLHQLHEIAEGRVDPRIGILEEVLTERRHQLQTTVAHVPATLRDVRPDDGRWSVAQVVEHLVMVERSVTDLVRAFVEQASPRAEGAAFDEQAFRDSLAVPHVLDRGRRVHSRPQSMPRGEMDADAAWRALTESRAAFVDAVRATAGRAMEDLRYPHPLLGELNLYEWIAFVGLHEARHAEQIRELVPTLEAQDHGDGTKQDSAAFAHGEDHS